MTTRSRVTTRTKSRAVPRDFEAMERRRRRAGKMFDAGKSQADVVRELEVSRQSASRWHADWAQGGTPALRGAGRAGRLPRLNERDLTRLERELLKGPLANGFPTDLWTLARVGEVIERLTGVSYHPGHVWRILTRLGWSRQRPARRALERDDAAIEHWAKVEWIRVKKTPDGERPGSSSKTRVASASSPR